MSPLFLFGGPLGAFFSPLAVSYVLALLASMAVAVIVTPALAMVLLRDASPMTASRPSCGGSQPRYDALLSRIVGAPRAACLIAGAIALAGLAVLPLLSWSPPPSFKERDVRITWEGGDRRRRSRKCGGS